MSDSEEPTVFHRKHKALLRREASFRRMESLPESVNRWFFGDAALHQAWTAFVAANKGRSATFGSAEAIETSLLGADHNATAVHEEFCEFFEAELAKFLAASKVSMDEFQEAFRISRDEEARDGTNFYRWPDVVEFPVFLRLMRGGTAAMLDSVRDASDEARGEYRKKVTLFPLLVRWNPDNFDAIADIVQRAASAVPLGLTRPEQKEMVRWRNKLSEKRLNSQGVYEAVRDEVAWSRFLAFATKRLTSEQFDAFLTHIDSLITAGSSNAVAETAEDKERRLGLDCFGALDVFHQGKVSLETIVEVIEKAAIIPAKTLKKGAVKWQHLLTQRIRDNTLAGKPEVDPDIKTHLNLDDAKSFFAEFLRPADGTDASDLYCARLEKVAQTARDR